MRIEYKKDRVSMSENEYRQVMNDLNQYKQAYQHCVDDLIVLRANNKRLERENERLIKKNNKVIATGLELTKYRSNYINLTNHIRTKAECNPGIWRYIDLVKYIDRLECADDER